jgi:hypothetical protein
MHVRSSLTALIIAAAATAIVAASGFAIVEAA